MSNTSHQDRILDQFSRQAMPFSTAATITDTNALRMIVEAAAPRPGDTLLDVACGGGIVVSAFAPHVKHATGIDVTPAMLDRARQHATEKRRHECHLGSRRRHRTALCRRNIRHRGDAFLHAPFPGSCWRHARDGACLCSRRSRGRGGHVRLGRTRQGRGMESGREAARSVACAMPDT